MNAEHKHAKNIDLIPIKKGEIENRDMQMWDLWKTRSSDKNNDNGKQSTENKLKKLCMEHTNSVAAQSNKNCTYYKMFDKLSWSTTGYHYDWTARSYTEQKKSPMPKQM